MRGDVAAYIATANGAPNQATIASISLQGAHFSLVSGARISTPGGWLSASVSNLTDTSLTLTPTASTPVGVAMPVELIVTGQPNVQAGSVTVQQNGAVYLFGVQAAQVHSRDITSPSLRLTSATVPAAYIGSFDKFDACADGDGHNRKEWRAPGGL